MSCCPNCRARNGSGPELVRRFQESDDETGLAMAIPLAHFQVSSINKEATPQRKLLCFTDHRQRAAAFPSLIEEETFIHDFGRKIISILEKGNESIGLDELGARLADVADPQSNDYDPKFFLPVSRYPDEELDSKGVRNLWVAEVFGYFGVPDSARESAEDIGLVSVNYQVKLSEIKKLRQILTGYNMNSNEPDDLLQVLLAHVRKRKAFTLPKGKVEPDAPVFGKVYVDVSFVERRDKIRNTYGWVPVGNRDNFVTNYLKRIFSLSDAEAVSLAEKIWHFLTSEFILVTKNSKTWKLDHERIYVAKAGSRYVCDRCKVVTTHSIKGCCPQKGCRGKLVAKEFEAK